MQFDHDLFYTINRWPDAWTPFFRFLSLATKNPVMVAVLALLTIALIWHKPTRKAAVLAVCSWPLANGVTDVLKAAFQMQRPCVELADVILRVPKLTSFGTASAHSANMAAVAFAFWWWGGWRWGIGWAILAFLTGISRIYVGVHYPSQVLLGWGCGCLTTWMVGQTYLAYKRTRRKDEPTLEEPKSAE